MFRPIRKLAGLSAAVVAFSAFGIAGTLGTAAIGIAPVAVAQEAQPQPPAGGSPRGKRMGQILLTLGLSDSQKSRIRDIIAAARKQNEGVTDRTQRRDTMKKAYAQVDTVLTPAQSKQFHAKMDAMHKEYQSQQSPH